MKKNYFFCYDENLKDFLKSNNLEYITHARAINSNRKFYLFESNNDLARLLQEYKMKTPKVGGKTTAVGNTP